MKRTEGQHPVAGAVKEESNGRTAGILLPLASLPSCYGIGDLGSESYQFVDMLQANGIRYWQILPLNPLGFGNSPYQPYSSYAGDPIYISLDQLAQAGWLSSLPPPFLPDAGAVDYERVRAYKDAALREAYARFIPDADYEAFARMAWVWPYAVFMAFKHENHGRSWLEWPIAQKEWPARRALDLAPYEAEIGYEMFLQYVFYTQWMTLKAYANAQDVEIVGDIPIYVGIDSLDVWAGRENFLLAADGTPTVVAGVPPDYFSETGQRWGNPIYDWDHLERDGFAFWVERLRYSSRLFDVIRIDHFRGFDTYWEIPSTCPTAVEGVWKEAPGYALFDTVMAALPGIRIIAEDLGMLRDEVYALRDHYHFRGMRIVQFFFRPDIRIAPREGTPHMVIYTGTHDNETTAGWVKHQTFAWRLRSRWLLWRAGYRRGSITRRLIQLAMDDAADIAIVPLADVMEWGDEARINTPGTVGSPNWEWKLRGFDGVVEGLQRFGAMARAGGRG